jgi:hypothetical protein
MKVSVLKNLDAPASGFLNKAVCPNSDGRNRVLPVTACHYFARVAYVDDGARMGPWDKDLITSHESPCHESAIVRVIDGVNGQNSQR